MKYLLDLIWRKLSHPQLRADSDQLFWVKHRANEVHAWCSVHHPTHADVAQWVVTCRDPQQDPEAAYTRYMSIYQLRKHLQREASR